jgi:hypothetical protein
MGMNRRKTASRLVVASRKIGANFKKVSATEKRLRQAFSRTSKEWQPVEVRRAVLALCRMNAVACATQRFANRSYVAALKIDSDGATTAIATHIASLSGLRARISTLATDLCESLNAVGQNVGGKVSFDDTGLLDEGSSVGDQVVADLDGGEDEEDDNGFEAADGDEDGFGDEDEGFTSADEDGIDGSDFEAAEGDEGDDFLAGLDDDFEAAEGDEDVDPDDILTSALADLEEDESALDVPAVNARRSAKSKVDKSKLAARQNLQRKRIASTRRANGKVEDLLQDMIRQELDR